MFFINIEKGLYLVLITINDTEKVNIACIIEKYDKQSFWLPGRSSSFKCVVVLVLREETNELISDLEDDISP